MWNSDLLQTSILMKIWGPTSSQSIPKQPSEITAEIGPSQKHIGITFDVNKHHENWNFLTIINGILYWIPIYFMHVDFV